ncbi:hypothetical protein NLS1_01140 [Nocardioides sp. LS1]|nr:hypothetical protein NLS1_01140 [Nocardioides sp. LS1]
MALGKGERDAVDGQVGAEGLRGATEHECGLMWVSAHGGSPFTEGGVWMGIRMGARLWWAE